jgi:opacity protein-like surface antigen
MRKGLIAATAALSVCGVSAEAADNGIYIGAGVGQSQVEASEGVPEIGSVDFDADATAYKVILGWRPLNWLAIEGNYLDLGSADDDVLGTEIESDIDGLSLSVLGFLPVGPVDLFARVGVLDWDAELTAPDFDIQSKDDGTDFAYGLGAQFRVWSLSLRAEYERFEISDVDKLDMLSIGVTWTFL